MYTYTAVCVRFENDGDAPIVALVLRTSQQGTLRTARRQMPGADRSLRRAYVDG